MTHKTYNARERRERLALAYGASPSMARRLADNSRAWGFAWELRRLFGLIIPRRKKR